MGRGRRREKISMEWAGKGLFLIIIHSAKKGVSAVKINF